MNREDIIRMAREAEIPGSWDLNWFDPYLERFATLVAAHERQWVGLTDEEIDNAAEQSDNYAAFHGGVRFAETKLKEKNT